MSPFNVQLDGTGSGYPAWSILFTVSAVTIVVPGPVRGYGAEGSEGALVAPPGFCKAGEVEDTGDWC